MTITRAARDRKSLAHTVKAYMPDGDMLLTVHEPISGGEIMGKTNFKGRRKTPPFVMIRHDMLRSPSFRSLMPPARAVYIEILNRYNGSNNAEIPLSCREAAGLCNISKGNASRAFKELQDRGFIRIGTAAGFNMKKRTSTRWRLTHEAVGGHTAPSNEWREWKPEIQNAVSPQVLIVSPQVLCPPNKPRELPA